MAELGETTDPRSLIPGSPDAIVENARVLRGRGQATTNTGEGLKRIDTGAWRGPAANAFHDKFSYEPVKWLQAGDSLDTGAAVLETYAETLRWAQGKAGEAIQQWEQGQNATAAAKSQHDQAVSQAEAQNQANAASGNPARVQAAPFSDPGEAIRQAARDTLNRARQQLIEAGDRTAATLRSEAAAAPEDRDWLDAVGGFFSDLGEGAWNTVSGLAETVWDILPIRAIWDPDGYTDGLITSAQGVWHSVTHPVDFLKGAVDWDDWTNGHPGRAIGQIAAGVAVGGVAGKLLKRLPGRKPHDKHSDTKTSDRRKFDEPATTPEARADVVRKGILDSHGKPLGVEDSKGVRIIKENELNQIRQHFHDQLGEPTNVIKTPKGTVEYWKISDDPKQTVAYRTYSSSGGPTIDINDVGDVDTKRFHVR
jgi:hypothetical protein